MKSSDIDLEKLKGPPSTYAIMAIFKQHLETIEASLPDLGAETFRGKILLLSARIEFLFGESLDHWVFGANKSKKSGSLSKLPFEKKAQMLETLGLLDQKTVAAVHGLRALRNDLAHSMSTNVEDLTDRKDIKALTEIFPLQSTALSTTQKLELCAIILNAFAGRVHNFCTSDSVTEDVVDRIKAFNSKEAKRQELATKIAGADLP